MRAARGCGLPAPESTRISLLNRILLGDALAENTRINLRGHFEQSFTLNPSNPPDRFSGPVAGSDRANDYRMQQFYPTLARPVGPTKHALDCGFAGEALDGSDASICSSFGLDDQPVADDVNAIGKRSFPQFYAELFVQVS